MHLHLVLTNRTTIESMEGAGYVLTNSVINGRASVKSLAKVNIYDMGAKNNWNSVMGDSWKEWILPIQNKRVSNGHEWVYDREKLQQIVNS